MRPVKIITDSCADLGRDLREKYDIDYARMLTIYDGKEQLASLDFEYYTPKELYDLMREGNRVTTAQVPEKEFERIFGKYLKDGFDIIYIGCSLKQSSSVNLGKVVAQKLMKNDPGSNIYCIDSLWAKVCLQSVLRNIAIKDLTPPEFAKKYLSSATLSMNTARFTALTHSNGQAE